MRPRFPPAGFFASPFVANLLRIWSKKELLVPSSNALGVDSALCIFKVFVLLLAGFATSIFMADGGCIVNARFIYSRVLDAPEQKRAWS